MARFLGSTLRQRMMSGCHIALLASVIVACQTPRAYDGPARRPEEVATVKVISSRTTLARVDGENVHLRGVELLPGEHVLQFAWKTARSASLIGPVMKTACYIEAELEAGQTYALDMNESKTSIGLRPPGNFRWTFYEVAPTLVRADQATALPGLICNPTCRAYGTKGSKTKLSACDAVDKQWAVPFDPHDPMATSPESVERSMVSKMISDRVFASCSRLRGLKQAECTLLRLPNHVSYALADGSVAIFVPMKTTELRPGLKNEVRTRCVQEGEPRLTDSCLESYGWERLPE